MNVAAGLSAEQDPSREGQERQSPASISGTVVDASSGTPLANIVVRWTADALDDKSEAFILGQSTSAPDGTFTISAYNTTDVEEALCRFRHRVSFSTYLETGRENERLRVDSNLDEILLRIDGEGEPPDDVSWNHAAEYLMTQRLLRASDLAAAIAKAPEGSPFASWNANRRAAALRRMMTLEGKPPAEQILERGLLCLVDSTETNLAAPIPRSIPGVIRSRPTNRLQSAWKSLPSPATGRGGGQSTEGLTGNRICKIVSPASSSIREKNSRRFMPQSQEFGKEAPDRDGEPKKADLRKALVEVNASRKQVELLPLARLASQMPTTLGGGA